MARTAPDQPSETILHATTVAVSGRGLMIRGGSGKGKSGLALQLLAMGGALVADDRTRLWRDGERIMAAAPAAIHGRIEARGVGILGAPVVANVPLALIADMETAETDRLPPLREDLLLGVPLPVVRKSEAAHFPAALKLYLTHGRLE